TSCLPRPRATTSTLHCIGRIRPTSSVFDTSTSTAMASVGGSGGGHSSSAGNREQFAAWKRQKNHGVLSSAVSAEMHGLPQNEKKEIESGSALSPFYLWNSEEDDEAPATTQAGETKTVLQRQFGTWSRSCTSTPGSLKQWWLVRYTAGMLDKRVETLPICLTDLLVRQKQVTIGARGLRFNLGRKSSAVLADLIKSACGNDITLGMLTQEILVYLSMLAKTESQLFANMHRIRVGLIIRIMGSEIGRSLQPDEATEHLLSLSPFANENFASLFA
uniref:Phosphorylase b kinase regulatory subunit n=1 Tax=Macrostomum lignano TaxID=282301 RepID=A0A1I8FH11_9PLAT